MTRSNTAIFILLITVFTSSGVAQSVDAVEELKVCARMTDQDARFACFDDLGEPKAVEYVGVITSCKKGRSGNWFFFFDNGQVWKDVNSRKLRFKECNFNATITKDAFGYKMRIDGEDRTIRVRRNR